MTNEQFFQHKLESIFDLEITQSYEDETGYYIQVDNQWLKLSMNKTNSQISNKINKMIKYPILINHITLKCVWLKPAELQKYYLIFFQTFSE